MKSALAASAVPGMLGQALWGQASLGQASWGGPVLDIHLHPRREGDQELEHLQGSGVTRAVLLPGVGSEERAKLVVQQHPPNFARFTNADVRQPDAISKLTSGVKSGAIGFGELKYPVLLDGPEMRRVYDLAADLNVPVLIHFQEGGWNTGFSRLPQILKEYSKTTFLAHANSWWAHISADVDDKIDYPKGAIKPGGLTDKMLADYPNVYGDLSANSGRNALARDPEFAAGFIVRHRAKLIFGSDCGCRDGHGTAQPQAPLNGKCTARETLTLLKQMATPELFRQIAWNNGTKLLKISG
ncbi:MAG: amidohydrolase family protein [Acidobacteriota bacterium]|nr:amidohydrolase family protein [Acidobacteriota bacterium]